MQIRQLSTAEELWRYVGFGEEVYARNPYWVPTDPHYLTNLLAGNGGFGPGSQIQPFWVEDEGRVLATVAAVRDEAYNRHWREETGHLLFFDALPDVDEAAVSLLGEASGWLRARGCDAARLSILPGLQLPLTIDAYESVPTIFHTYNPPYYHSYVKNAGFETEKGVVEYQVRFTPELAARYREMAARAEGAGVSLRPCDFGRLEEESATYTEIFNETFSAHWGSMPLPAAAMRDLTVELKDLIVPDFLVFAEAEGRTAGAVYSLPDLNRALHPMRGRSIAEHFPEFRRRLGEIDHGVLLIIGVRKEFRGRGAGLALAAKSYLAMIERGYKSASYTVVIDDNWPSRRTAEKLGARVTRNFNVYRKGLAG